MHGAVARAARCVGRLTILSGEVADAMPDEIRKETAIATILGGGVA